MLCRRKLHVVSTGRRGFSLRRSMLSRFLPPIDEAASMLRLLNLLNWPDPNVPTLLFGPLFEAISYFEIEVPPHPVKSQWDPPDLECPLHRCVAWRINMHCELIRRSGTLNEYFPFSCRRDVLSILHGCLDSMFPLLNAIEANPSISLEEIYQKRLEPESNRHMVVDSSCTSFISQLMPFVFEATSYIPEIVLKTIGCDAADPSLQLLVTLLKQLTIERDKMRNFSATIFNILRHNDEHNWLCKMLVIVVKYALLGNYPGARSFVTFKYRRLVYNMTNENVQQFLYTYSGPKSQAREAELCVTSVLLSMMLVGVFSPFSADYVPMDDLVHGWKPLASLNERVMSLIVIFFPVTVNANLITDISRFFKPLTRKYQNIFYAIAANARSTITNSARWNPLRESIMSLVTLCPLVPILTNDNNPLFMQNLQSLQATFNSHGRLQLSSLLSPSQKSCLESLAVYYKDRKVLQLSGGTHSLYLEHAARLLKLTGALAPERTTVLYCQSCNTVRFRPVGIKLPHSHITLLVDLNFGHIHCVDCDSTDIVRVNLIGKFLRCYLIVKRRRPVVTLSLCSACLHVSVCGFSAYKHGVVCAECKHTVAIAALPTTFRHCIACKSISPKVTADSSMWIVLMPDDSIQTHTWCDRCIPTDYSAFRKTTSRVPLLTLQTITSVSNPPYIYQPGTRHY